MKNKIKGYRGLYNITQQQLADSVEVSRQTIISLESGRYNPSILLVYRISKVFVFEEE